MKIFFAAVFLFVFTGCTSVHHSMNYENSSMETFDLSRIPNGTFLGKYHLNDGDFQVEVTVEMHMIVCIKIISGMQKKFKKKCALCKTNELIQDIIDWQTVNKIDGISGATQTSNAILNAIKDALSPPYHFTIDNRCSVRTQNIQFPQFLGHVQFCDKSSCMFLKQI